MFSLSNEDSRRLSSHIYQRDLAWLLSKCELITVILTIFLFEKFIVSIETLVKGLRSKVGKKISLQTCPLSLSVFLSPTLMSLFCLSFADRMTCPPPPPLCISFLSISIIVQHLPMTSSSYTSDHWYLHSKNLPFCLLDVQIIVKIFIAFTSSSSSSSSRSSLKKHTYKLEGEIWPKQ